MYNIRLFFTAIFFLGIAFYSSGATGKQTETSENNYIITYYFHGNFRCPSCLRIEQYTKEAVEQYFKDRLESGKMVFKVINVEDKGNERFVNDYQLYTKSVIVALYIDNKQIKFKNLTRVWELLRNREKFYSYIKDEIEEYLKELGNG